MCFRITLDLTPWIPFYHFQYATMPHWMLQIIFICNPTNYLCCWIQGNSWNRERKRERERRVFRDLWHRENAVWNPIFERWIHERKKTSKPYVVTAANAFDSIPYIGVMKLAEFSVAHSIDNEMYAPIWITINFFIRLCHRTLSNAMPIL